MPVKNQRVVIFCLGLETVKVYRAIEYYSADEAYMLYWASGKPYPEFKEEIVSHFKKKGWKLTPVEVRTYDFIPTLARILSIITRKDNETAHFNVDITGTSAYSAAAMVACMMTKAEPFFFSTKKYLREDPEAFFVDGRPFGMSKEIGEKPMDLVTFPMKLPPEKEVRGLREYRRLKLSGALTTYPKVIQALDAMGLIELVDKDGAPVNVTDANGKLISAIRHRASMYYKRNFLDKWVENGWLEKDSKKGYRLTQQGNAVADVFYVDEDSVTVNNKVK